MISTPEAVVGFWRAAGPARWFRHEPLFDAQVSRRLGRLYALAADGGLDAWLDDPVGALAVTILLDQVPRNIHRGTPLAFATDGHARAVGNLAIARGFDWRVPPVMRPSFYLPLMHSEDLDDQERCVDLYRAHGGADGVTWAELHRDIVVDFGRFPHRNAILGRVSTPEEMRYLADGGFKG